MKLRILIASSAIALGMALTATPASAQVACDLNGGPQPPSTAPQSLECGQGALINNEAATGATSVGNQSTVNGGVGTVPDDFVPVPVGDLGGTALGGFAAVNGDNNVAVGAGALVGLFDSVTNNVVDGGTAIGTRANVSADQGTALGQGAQAIHANSVALGAGTATTATNQVHVGGRTVSGVTAGAVNATSTDAVNGSQLFATNTNVTTLTTQTTANTTAITAVQTVNTTQATQITALQATDTAFDTRIDTLEAAALDFGDGLDRVDDRASSGTATAIALGGNAFLPDKSFNVTANAGTYRGAWAGALQIGAMIGENMAVNAGVAHGFNKRGGTGARAGITFGW